MKRLIHVGLCLFVVLTITCGSVYADNDDDRYEVLEDIGVFFGWGIVAMGVAAGVLFPLRRYSKVILVRMPSIREKYRNGLRLLAKLHPVIGLTALGLGIVHGVLMFLHEGELGGREWLGVIAVVLLSVAASFGFQLYKKKKNFKQMRKYHITLITIVAALAVIHIVLA